MQKEKFFDRKIHLEILQKRVRGLKEGYRQNIAIIGDEMVGKTAIVFKFLNSLFDPKIVTVYFEVRPESLSVFSRRFIGILLYNFLANSGIPLREDLDFLLLKSAKFIPRTVEAAKSLLWSQEKRKKNNILGDLFSLCEILKEESGKSCIVILDEFHNLENIGIRNLYGDWSRVLLMQKNTMYIIISSRKHKARGILAKNLSLLFGNFEVLTVEPFDNRISGKYLDYRFGQVGIEIDAGLKDFLIFFTGGHPFYLELIAQAYLKSDGAALEDVLEGMLFDPTGSLNQRFSDYLKRFFDLSHNQEYLAIMHLISKGHNKIKDVAHLLHKPKSQVMTMINSLLELDAINRSGDFLSLSDRVFGFWLRYVYQEKIQSMTFDAKNQKLFFRKNIATLVEEFLLNAKKPVAERVQELLRLFSDEVIQIEKKKLKLTSFREIKPLQFSRKNLTQGLIGRAQDALWIIAFKPDTLNEEDVAEFSRECRRYRHKLQRKIIVAPCGIEENAKLRAMEEKVMTWDLDRVNQILDLYARPRIIL